MSVTAVAGQEGSVVLGINTNSRAFAGNVTAGNRIILVGSLYSGGAATIAAGDCTKSAGTATIGAITLDFTISRQLPTTDWIHIGIWSCAVTGTGSCTMTLANASLGACNFGSGEYHSDVGAITPDAGQTSGAGALAGAPDSGNVTTSAPGIIVGGLAINGGGTITITQDGAFTQLMDNENGNTDLAGDVIRRIMAASGTDSASWTAPTLFEFLCGAAAYSEPAAGGGSADHQLVDAGLVDRGLVDAGLVG